MNQKDKILENTVFISLLIGLFLFIYTNIDHDAEIGIIEEEISLIERDEIKERNEKLYDLLKAHGIQNARSYIGNHLIDVNMTIGDSITYTFTGGDYIILDYNTNEVIDYSL